MKNNKIGVVVWPLYASALFIAQSCLADDSAYENETGADIETIVVYGRELNLLGIAKAASEGTVGYDDFKDRPISRVGELVEVIPGAIATQHSGEGKANQYFLRGFNLDHGTDFSAHVDGVPVNLRTHGHGQGYLDLNFVIPEVVERVDYTKGPYSVNNGDFSSAGAARYKFYETLENPFVQFTAGEFDYYRSVMAGSFELGPDTNILLAVEGALQDGPWILEQDLEKINSLAKITHRSTEWETSLNLGAYSSSYIATDQIPQRVVDSGLIDRFGFIDDDLGGSTNRFSASITSQHEAADFTTTNLSAYIVNYDFSLFSNFTYFLDDPVNGDEFEQLDERTYFGGAITQERFLSERATLAYGIEGRYDNISDLGLFRTQGRQRLATLRRDQVKQSSVGLWASGEYSITPDIRLSLGLRGDYYHGSVDAISLPANSGKADDTLISPTLGLAWRATDELELYANYGHGFHSNDVRGATISIDPASNEQATQIPILVQSKGAEVGARYSDDNFVATVSLFSLSLDSELVFVGDAGTTEANDGSDRYGVEASVFWRPVDWLALDMSGALTDVRFDINGVDDEIPGAVSRVFGGGVVVRFDTLTVSARIRHFGGAPLTEDGTIKAPSTTLLNGSVNHKWHGLTLGFELLNLLDTKDNDISYFFASQLQGESSPVEDIHFHPVEPRQIRFSVRYDF
ncbi:TonB-dependent receptor [Kordiimonas aquimaris]|uniref:TonB-dependent receptor n=1 Tax=Kordiimonas aquimaris TaxID=707591 RepID=UPI0021D1C188|nr:TonB-dependent receptor [Kordiimonas aquimaris]